MKKLTLIILMLAPSLAWTQKVLVLTLKPDEELDPDNSKIITTATGATHEIVTMNNGKMLLYTKTVKGKSIGVDRREGDFVTSGEEDGKRYFRNEVTGKKYGPLEEINAIYDEEKKIFYGYSYMKDGMTYYQDEINNKLYGPYYKGGIWLANGKDLVYSNTIKNAEGKEEVFLFENDKKYGPYESVSYKRSKTEGVPALITWKEGGKFYCSAPQVKGAGFGGIASAIEIKGGWLIETWDKSYSERMIHLPDGTKLDYKEKLKHATNAQGEYLKFEHVAGGGDYAAFKVSYKGKEIGTFAVKKYQREELSMTDIFDHQLMAVDLKGNWSNAKTEENYLYSASKGLIGPLKAKDLYHTFIIKDGWATIREDSTLEINGKKVMNKITWFDGKNYPTTWYAFQKRGDYVYPFKNGVEVQASDVPEKLRYMCTAEKNDVKVQRNNEFFIRVKGSDKLLGPIGQYDSYVLSPDGKHYAYMRGQDDMVVVNGKPVTNSGQNIVYNEKLKAFHWYVIQGQNVYLYTHKLAATGTTAKTPAPKTGTTTKKK